MVNLFINVYIYLGTRWHKHTGSVTEFWKYARLLNMVSVTCIISIPAPLFKRGWHFVARFLQFCCRWLKKRAARGGWSPGLTFRYRYMPGNTPDVRNYSSQLKQETESENNLVRFLLCIDFQHLRALRHCTLASPTTAPPGAKRPQKAKKPKHA